MYKRIYVCVYMCSHAEMERVLTFYGEKGREQVENVWKKGKVIVRETIKLARARVATRRKWKRGVCACACMRVDKASKENAGK